MTNHLSRYSNIFPKHTKEFTRTCKKKTTKLKYWLIEIYTVKRFDILGGKRNTEDYTRTHQEV